MSTYLRKGQGGLYLSVTAVPNADRTKIVEEYNGTLKIKIAAAPEKGKANKELEDFLGDLLGLASYEVNIVQGQSSNRKLVKIIYSDLEKVQEVLEREMD